MIHKIAILVAATVVGSTVALAQLPLPIPLPGMQGTPEDRAACEPDVKRHCQSAIRTSCACWVACRTIASGSVRLARGCWSDTDSNRMVPCRLIADRS